MTYLEEIERRKRAWEQREQNALLKASMPPIERARRYAYAIAKDSVKDAPPSLVLGDIFLNRLSFKEQKVRL